MMNRSSHSFTKLVGTTMNKILVILLIGLMLTAGDGIARAGPLRSPQTASPQSITLATQAFASRSRRTR
jgi:hypothetical protein